MHFQKQQDKILTFFIKIELNSKSQAVTGRLKTDYGITKLKQKYSAVEAGPIYLPKQAGQPDGEKPTLGSSQPCRECSPAGRF